MTTVWGVFRDGKIELAEPCQMPEGTRVLVTPFAEDQEDLFWAETSQSSLSSIWNNSQDDVYAQLLEK